MVVYYCSTPKNGESCSKKSQASAPGVALVLEHSAGRSQGQPFERASQGKFLRKWGRKCQLWPFYMGNFHEILGEEYRTN